MPHHLTQDQTSNTSKQLSQMTQPFRETAVELLSRHWGWGSPWRTLHSVSPAELLTSNLGDGALIQHHLSDAFLVHLNLVYVHHLCQRSRLQTPCSLMKARAHTHTHTHNSNSVIINPSVGELFFFTRLHLLARLGDGRESHLSLLTTTCTRFAGGLDI